LDQTQAMSMGVSPFLQYPQFAVPYQYQMPPQAAQPGMRGPASMAMQMADMEAEKAKMAKKQGKDTMEQPMMMGLSSPFQTGPSPLAVFAIPSGIFSPVSPYSQYAPNTPGLFTLGTSGTSTPFSPGQGGEMNVFK
jgi:hypothetical protein